MVLSDNSVASPPFNSPVCWPPSPLPDSRLSLPTSCLSSQSFCLQQKSGLPSSHGGLGHSVLASTNRPILPEFSLGHCQTQEQNESFALRAMEHACIFSRPRWMAIGNECLAKRGCIHACNKSRESGLGATYKQKNPFRMVSSFVVSPKTGTRGLCSPFPMPPCHQPHHPPAVFQAQQAA